MVQATNSELILWLLQAKTPTIRYLTRRDLLAASADRSGCTGARREIMKSGPVPAILAHQTEAGSWEGEHSYYTPKYLSTHWSMTLLAELHAEPGDARLQRGARYMLDATDGELRERIANGPYGFSCFWGNLLRYALQAGASATELEPLVVYAVQDLQAGPCRCRHNDGLTCGWGVVRTLWGLAALPRSLRPPEVEAAIAQGVSFLLENNQLVEADYPLPENGRIHPLWFRLNFPLFYQVDILFTLRVLGDLDLLQEPGVAPALDWLEHKRGSNGRWRGSSPFRQRTWPALGDREEADRWASLHAARVLRQAGRFAPEQLQAA